MIPEEKQLKRNDRFKINVAKFIELLLENKVFLTKRKASLEACKLIMDYSGYSRRQAQKYLAAARKEILRVAEEKKLKAIDSAIEKNELSGILP